jgi:hypothetical protein
MEGITWTICLATLPRKMTQQGEAGTVLTYPFPRRAQKLPRKLAQFTILSLWNMSEALTPVA